MAKLLEQIPNQILQAQMEEQLGHAVMSTPKNEKDIETILIPVS
ncbi:hypothetical protein [Parageobacillus thermantarcticus]|nr:hypothetical protein [Parageobacillus thermantarcticus]